LAVDGDGDGDGGGDDDGGDGVGGAVADGDGDVLAHLVKPKGEQMKPSYEFRWYRGDHYARRWSVGPPAAMVMVMEMGPIVAAGTGMEMEMETETYCHIWSSRKVSQQIKTNKKEKQ